jgi:predicted transcriptional regulator of viral defense system
MEKTDRERLVGLARKRTFLTAREVSEAGIHSHQLTRLVAEGTIERIARGCYRLAAADATEHHGLALVAAAAPAGVICLLSALSFHAIGTQLPFEVWLAIERGSRAPKVPYPRLRIVRFSGAAFHEGIEHHEVESQRVRVYSVAKTLADLFKARNRVGLDVAIEALREAWRDRRFTMAELDRASRVCRVERVMRPYVEGIVA